VNDVKKGHLTSRIGRDVNFGPPEDVGGKGGNGSHGVIVDEFWVDPALNVSEPHTKPCPKGDHCWGDYSFCAQLIRWDEDDSHKRHTIRLAYYRRRCGEDFWTFASQMTVNDEPSIVERLCQGTLKNVGWFIDPPQTSN